MMTLLCRLGWHDWGRWVPGRIARRGRWVSGQKRVCLRCQREERREL